MNVKRKSKVIMSALLATGLLVGLGYNIIPRLNAGVGGTITGSPIVGQNAVQLNWAPPGNGEKYTYRLYEKGPNDKEFQSIPAKEHVKVLNIYPGLGDNLKSWMETPNCEDARGYGKGLIETTKVDIDTFNSDPNSWLGGPGNWKYDVVYLGAWDGNNLKDLTVDASNRLADFIKTGRGYLGGHDTMGVYFPRNLSSFNISLLRSYLNIKLGIYGNTAEDAAYYNKVDFPMSLPTDITGSQINVKKKGLLTSYPWNIGEIGTTLDIPFSHSTAQFAYGDIWMDFVGPGHRPSPNGDGEGNFYLTTWNNTAMIQTGNSRGQALPAEQKLLANTLFLSSTGN